MPVRTLVIAYPSNPNLRSEKCSPIPHFLTNFAAPDLTSVFQNLTIPRATPKTLHMQCPKREHLQCLEQLTHRQLLHGGWPFHSSAAQAAVEPTALALLALPSNLVRERDRAIRFLLRIQNSNGSWPAFPGDDPEGSGFTGLAVYALHRSGVKGTATDRAIRWLMQSRGWESHWLWKWKFRTTDRHVRFNPDKFGWPWMPKTVSWVVPTAYSLLALRQVHGGSQQDLLQFRMRRGVEMLYDRICPEGGWNAGNGVVYGSALAPHPDATAVALLALFGEPLNDFTTASLDWLERRAESLHALWSLAWTILALHAYHRPIQPLIDNLRAVVEPLEINDCATLALVCLALHCAGGPNVFGVNA